MPSIKIFIAIILAASFIGGGYAAAQTFGAGIQILPSIIEERVDPGQWLTKSITITNLSDESLTYKIVKRDIGGIASNGTPLFKDEREKTGLELSSWITTAVESVFLRPRQSKKINFSIYVPRQASPGSHVASLLFASTPDRPETSGAAVAYQVGTIIHLRISGVIFEEAEIMEFHANHFIYSRPKVEFTAKVANLGNVIIRPRGPIEITNMFGRKIDTVVINDSAAAVLPKTERSFSASWESNSLAFGRYQAIASLAFGEDDIQTMSRATFFWILPLHVIIPVFAGLIILILIVLFLIKLHIKKKLHELTQATKNIVQQRSDDFLERDLIHHKKHAPISQLAALAIAMAVFVIIFALLIFIFFA